jgi:Domain of unknown function (DUF4926)
MELLDVVVLTQDIESKKLKKGSLGTIIEELSEGIFMVEFVDTKGITYATPILSSEQLLKVYYEPIEA